MKNQLHAWMRSAQKPFKERNALGKTWYIIRWPFLALLLIAFVAFIAVRIFFKILVDTIFDRLK